MRKYRKSNKLSQQKFAAMLNISQSYLGSLERDEKQPSRQLLISISDKLNISIDKLLSNEAEYISKQAANSYAERIQALPKNHRESLYNVIEIFLSIFEK